MGETVEALAAEADVKRKAKEKFEEQKAFAQAKLDEATERAKEQPQVAAVAGGVVLLLLLMLIRRRRR
ncbi:MAG: hypothetical protein M3217_05835 [Actinomycetota bacterium]|nr:hypothetical protein [Actinomycetota bacterium]